MVSREREGVILYRGTGDSQIKMRIITWQLWRLLFVDAVARWLVKRVNNLGFVSNSNLSPRIDSTSPSSKENNQESSITHSS